MAQGTLAISGPAFMSSSAANIYTPPASTIYIVIKHIHLANVTVAAASFSLYKGLTAGVLAGTELFKSVSIAANSYLDYYPNQKMLSVDFLSGLASAGSTITITVEYELFVV
jgi:hypothetical protein